jgi:hypothetical protein
LVIDSGRGDVLAPFGSYFEPRWEGSHFHLTLEPDLLEVLEAIDCHPPALTGRVGSYETVNRDSKFFDRDSGELLSFDFRRSYDSPLLVHEQCGGGRGVGVLSQLRLTQEFAAAVRERLEKLPRSYVGVHVRNTDVRTDYKTFFEEISEALQGKSCLICSDDRRCIDYARQFFTECDIHTVSEIPDTGGARLHGYGSSDMLKTNVDAVADLIGLARSSTIIRPRRGIGYSSGFASLAMELHWRPRLLKGLIDLDPAGP